MHVEQGEIFGFLGPNGAGKMTTVRCMLDVIRPTAGTLRILGLDAQRDTQELHRRIGYLPGDVRLPGDMTGKQIIDYFSRLQKREPVRLNDRVARLDKEIKRPLKGYSKGMRQKIGIALAFMCDPEVLIPIAALFTIAFAWLTALFVSNPGIDWKWFWITQLVQFCLFFLAGSIGMLMGSFLHTSRAAAGAAVGILALGYLFNTFGALSDKLSWLLNLTIASRRVASQRPRQQWHLHSGLQV